MVQPMARHTRRRPLLVVNADDWGSNALATDRIADCFEARAISSASAMMFMADSERAAAVAVEKELPIGLHLNLTEAFDGAVPPDVATRQAGLAARFAGSRVLRYVYDPRLRADVACCTAEQFERFRETYGREPTHVDGHNHVQLCPTVLSVLPRGVRVRTAWQPPVSPVDPMRAARKLRHVLIARRFRTTDHFFPVRAIHPAFGGSGLDAALALADRESVELMVHPAVADEYALLTAPAWASTVGRRQLRSFADL